MIAWHRSRVAAATPVRATDGATSAPASEANSRIAGNRSASRATALGSREPTVRRPMSVVPERTGA
jgi:hypothetical protein